MNRIFIGPLLLALAVRVFCQDGAALLEQLPPPPSDVCRSLSQRDRYSLQIAKVRRDIDAALAKRRKEQKANVKKNEAAWREQMMRQSGLTPEMVAQMKAASRQGRAASAAAKRQLADQVLQQQTDLSIAEVKNVKTLDPEAKNAWAQAYATQQLSTAQAQAQAQTPAQQEADERKRQRLARLATLAKEQQQLLEETGAGRDRLWAKIRELEDNAKKAYQENVMPIDLRLERLKEKIRQFDEDAQRQYAELAGPGRAGDARDIKLGELQRANGKQRDELLVERDQMELERDDALRQHCATFTPPYCELLRQYLTWAKGAQAGFARYEEMENEKFKLQTDSPEAQLLVAAGTLSLQEAKACADLLQTAFKFALQDPLRPLDGSKRQLGGAEP